MSLSLNQFFMLFMWFPLTALLLLLMLIARFFERFSGQTTYYKWIIVPVVLFGFGFVRYASIQSIAGDALGDILLGMAGLSLLLLSSRLYWLMIVNR
jgi:hypothetical protein